MTIATILPTARTVFFDSNDNPLAGGKVYFYVPPNTNTAKTTWQDATGSVANSQPIILDANGSALIYGSGQYFQKLYDSDDNLIYTGLTQDTYGFIVGSNNTFTGSNTFEGNATFINGTVAIGTTGTAETVMAGDNSTNIATTAFVHTALTSISATTVSAGGFVNLSGSAQTATTYSVTADQVVAKTALNGTPYLGSSLSMTLDIGTVGAGGMDIGVAPTSGDLSIYVIYNPNTTTWNLLGVLGATSNGTIYSGSHMPSGYTASCLVSTIKTNGSAQFNGTAQKDRFITFPKKNAINTGTATSFTSVSISSLVPSNSRSIAGTIGSSNSSSTGQAIASDAGGTGEFVCNAAVGTTTDSFTQGAAFYGLLLSTAQTIYYKNANSANNCRIDVSGYTF